MGIFFIRKIFVYEKLTDFPKMVETGVDPRLHIKRTLSVKDFSWLNSPGFGLKMSLPLIGVLLFKYAVWVNVPWDGVPFLTLWEYMTGFKFSPFISLW